MPLLASAEDAPTHFRLLIHDTEQFNEYVGLAGWVVVPNITTQPSQWLVVAGPKFFQENCWWEIMSGAIIQDGAAAPLLDVRADFSVFKPLNFWVNLEWIDPTQGIKTSSFYSYFEGNYSLLKTFSVGFETENVHQSGDDILSIGPHIGMHLSAMNLIVAYQLHYRESNVVWLRAVLNF